MLFLLYVRNTETFFDVVEGSVLSTSGNALELTNPSFWVGIVFTVAPRLWLVFQNFSSSLVKKSSDKVDTFWCKLSR